MKMLQSSWSSTMFKVLLVAALPMHVWTYKILLVPWIGKSHVLSMATVAEGLVSRGHMVTLFIGEHFPLKHLELRNRAEISVVKYRDTRDGVYLDYDAMNENHSKLAIETGGDIKYLLVSIMSELCVRFSYIKLKRICVSSHYLSLAKYVCFRARVTGSLEGNCPKLISCPRPLPYVHVA